MSEKTTLTEIRNYCAAKEGTTEDFPFDFDVLTIRIGGKIFLLCDITSNPLRFNLKCDPDNAIMLREKYPAITPGYHMNKRHWNTVTIDGTLAPELIYKMIDDSYSLVYKGLTKKEKESV